MRRCLNCMREYAEEYEDKCPYCGYIHGATHEEDMGLLPGTILQNRYIVGTVIRVRDVDVCYRGWDAIFDRQVRIQEYFPRYCAARFGASPLTIYESKQEPYREGLELFLRQSRELIRMYREPDVVTYHACFEENRTAYAIMEARELATLQDRIDEGRIDESEAQRLLGQAWEAVEKCHEIGVSHGLIDPESFWCKGDGGLILKDFGAWRYVSGEPGIVNYGNPGQETDVYGLAKLFCQMVTGQEIADVDMLKRELLMSRTALSKNAMTAMNHALSHETRTMWQLREELGGRVAAETEESFARNRSRQRDLRSSLRIPRGVAIAAAVIVALILVLTLVMGVGSFVRIKTGASSLEENMVRMPNVVNEDADEAETILADENLGMSRDRMEFSEEIPENLISYQEVPANSVVAQGTEVMVYISKGKEKGVIPSVTGLMREEALKALEEARFQNVIIKESMESGLYDSVLEISQVQGANVALSEEIILTVCVNEKNQEGDASVQVEAPELSVLSREEAEAALEEIGLKANWVEEYSDEPEGTILAQDPAAGEMVNKDTYVTVRISVGQEKIYMTSVQLMSLEEATAEIEALGLTVGSVTREYSDSVAPGSVISQSVANGEEVKEGDSVNLVVSLGKDPAKQTQAAKRETAPETTAAPETTTRDALQGLLDGTDGSASGGSGTATVASETSTSPVVTPDKSEGSGTSAGPAMTDEASDQSSNDDGSNSNENNEAANQVSEAEDETTIEAFTSDAQKDT